MISADFPFDLSFNCSDKASIDVCYILEVCHLAFIKARFYKGKLEEFQVKIAQTPEEIKGLLEVGFEYVCEKDDLLLFRKRK